MKYVVLIAALTLAPVAFAAEQQQNLAPDPDLNDPVFTYNFCLALTKEQPDKAIELAGKWVGLGGGEPAKHCQALSLIGLKEYGEGATRLEALAVESRQEPTVRASMLAQAGQAWMQQGELSRAYASQTAALKIVPAGSKQQMELYLDRAVTLADAGKFDEVIEDCNAALIIDPNNSDALAYRAAAHRLQGNEEEAFADADRAVKADTKNVAALLERGNLWRMQKRLAAARQDWMRILELEPDSAAADAARINIERLDVDVHAR